MFINRLSLLVVSELTATIIFVEMEVDRLLNMQYFIMSLEFTIFSRYW